MICFHVSVCINHFSFLKFRLFLPSVLCFFLISFFSSGYLDVSVPRVPLVKLWIHFTIRRHYPPWVPSFGHLRIFAYLQLPAAFRSLSRPSSAPCTKASSCMLFVAWSFFRLHFRNPSNLLSLHFLDFFTRLLSSWFVPTFIFFVLTFHLFL